MKDRMLFLVVFAGLCFALVSPLTAQWSYTGDLQVARSYHTATLLMDGRVLIAAGQHQQGPQTHAVAEIYDPATGAFSTTGGLLTDRSGHAAALLPDGRVLIAGGLRTTTPGMGIFIKSCEIYDPATGLFAAAGDMSAARCNFSLIPLPDGRILAAGSASSNRGEIFNPHAGSWTLTGTMLSSGRQYFHSVVLPNGKILFIGGMTRGITRSVEMFDPVSGTFTFADSMNTPRYAHSATLLQDGRILGAGGYANNTSIKTAEIITPAALGVAVIESALPADYTLQQNYPNPFNNTTTVEYTLLKPGMVTVEVLDLLGKTVATLDQGIRRTGVHRLHWSGRNAVGREMSSGCYYLRLTAPGFSQSRKMLLLR